MGCRITSNTLKASKKIRVVFVGGYGRSGSTIIDMLLNRVNGITTVGEFRHLFGRALGDNELCSCSKPFLDCDFWVDVINDAFPNGLDRQKIHSAMKRINRVASVNSLNRNKVPKSIKYDLEIYIKAFDAAYLAVAKKTGSKAIVDSSKYPLHALAMSHSNTIELRTILLVRDPRAVANSWERRRIRPEVHWEKRYMPRHNAIRSALAWNLSNSLTERLNSNKNKFVLQRYEDFIENPIQELSKLASFALDKPTAVTNKVFIANKNKNNHTIAGNPIRLSDKKFEVRPDDAWKSKMNPIKKQLVKLTCKRQMKRYNYL